MKVTKTGAARAVLERLLGQERAERFDLSVLTGTRDEFSIGAGADDRISVVGSSVPTLLAGVRWYVSHELHGHISRHGDQLPTAMTVPTAPIQLATRFSSRFAHNPTVSGYSAAYWGWAEWERELDFLAWSGTTHVSIFTGQEIVYRDLLTELGLSDQEARAWLSMPGHMAWQWMGNLHGYGGGQPAELLEQRAQLGRRIVDRVRELGMTPVLPGFAGYVPQQLVDERADLSAVPQGVWFGFDRPAWIDPTCEGFQDIATRWYRLQSEHFGASTAYAMDVMHEGGTAGSIDVADATRNLQRAILNAHPDAAWVIQAWGSNPTEEMLAGLDKSRLLVLDINADDTPRWNSRNAFDGAPWVFGTISTWGGRQYTFGKLPEIARLPGLTSTGELKGTVQAAESLESNPVVDDLLADVIWHETDVDLDEWIAGYSRRRYGAESEQAKNAWRTFARTAYGQHIGDDDGSNAGPDSLFIARPGLDIDRAIEWRPRIVPYDAGEFEDGWRELLAAADQLADSEAYRHDVVDFTVQVLSNRSRWLLPQIKAAVQIHDASAVEALSAWFMRLLEQCDEILATRTEFLLGTWLTQAFAAAGAAGVDDVLTLVTTWGSDRTTGELHDYAARHAAGLVHGYHGKRWSHFFAGLRSEGTADDWFALERAWALQLRDVPTETRGDTVTVAAGIAGELPPNGGSPVTVALEADSEPGGTLVTATVVNSSDAEVVLSHARLLHRNVDPILDMQVVLRPQESHRLEWRLPHSQGAALIEVAVYFDPSSTTTRVSRATL